MYLCGLFFFFQAEDGIRDAQESRGLGDVYKRQLRTFHVGGVAGSASVESTMPARFDGTIQFDGLRTVATEDAEGKKVNVVIGRTGEVRIMDVKNDRLLTTNNIPYGATLSVKDGQKVTKGEVICTWDPFNLSLIHISEPTRLLS